MAATELLFEESEFVNLEHLDLLSRLFTVSQKSRRRMVALLHVSEGPGALASTVLLLQEMKILPTEMYCDSCLEIQSSKIHSMLIISLLNCLHGLPQSQIPGYPHPLFSLRIICVTIKIGILCLDSAIS